MPPGELAERPTARVYDMRVFADRLDYGRADEVIVRRWLNRKGHWVTA